MPQRKLVPLQKPRWKFSCLERYSLIPVLFLTIECVSPSARAQVTEADRALTTGVFQQLLAVAPVPKDVPWPPKLEISDKDELNAYATIRREGAVVVCYNGLLRRVIEGNRDRLAYVLGHELSHHILGHTRTPSVKTEFLEVTFTREQEIAADDSGMQLALRANYSYRGGLTAIRKMIGLGSNYSSFEGLRYDHPSWLDRIALLDHDQTNLWRSMSAFDNGVYFLLVQNFLLAERAFRQVTDDFPGSYEAWSNLGYALMMQYADLLNAEDLQAFGVGQVVTGGFYRRPRSLEGMVRGVNVTLWSEAVRALLEAERLKPDLSLPKANLGISYLFRPAGKDAAKAVQMLEDAVSLAKKDATLDSVSSLTEVLNLAVAYAAQGSTDKAMDTLQRVESVLKQPPPRSIPGSFGVYSALSSALSYNRASLLAQSNNDEGHRRAIAEFEEYLRHTSSALSWWTLAYQRYSALCKNLGVAPASSTVLAQVPDRFRAIAGVTVGAGQLALGDTLEAATTRLGPAASTVSLIRDTNLAQLDYPQYGIKLIADNEVLAIVLAGNRAPAISTRMEGLSSTVVQLKIGMTNAEIDKLLGNSECEVRQLVDPNLNYRFYSDIGVAVLADKSKVIQLVIAQIPKRSS